MTGPASTPAPDPGAEPKLEVRWHFTSPFYSKLLDRIALFKTELARADRCSRVSPPFIRSSPVSPQGAARAAKAVAAFARRYRPALRTRTRIGDAGGPDQRRRGRGKSPRKTFFVPREHIAERASMRPRRIAAENRLLELLPSPRLDASMRPRRIAAENWGNSPHVSARRTASMRPRRIAAENNPGPDGGVVFIMLQ